MRKVGVIFFFFFYLMISSQNQNRFIDSMKNVLATSNVDTTKANALLSLSIREIQSGNYNGGINYASQAYDLSLKADYKKGLSGSLNNIGAAYFSKGDYPEAIDHYSKAAKIKEAAGDKKGSASTLGNIGAVFCQQGDYPKALEYYYKSLTICESLDDKKGIATQMSNIGLVHIYQQDYTKAFDIYTKLIEHYKKNSLKKGEFYAIAVNNLGIVYQHRGMYDKAIEYFLESYEVNNSIGNKRGISMTYSNMADAYGLKKEYDKSLELHLKSLQLSEETGDRATMSLDNANIGVTYYLKKDYKKAIEYCSKSLEMEKEIGNLQTMQIAYEYLSKTYSEMGNDKQAFSFYKLSEAFKDSMFNEENTKKSLTSEMNFAFEKKQAGIKAENEKALALAAAEKHRQSIIIWAVSIGLGLVLILVLVVLRSLRENKNKNKIITEQKKLVEEKQKEVVDSINYAKRIQTGILPDEEEIRKVFPESFVLFKPKDIVSGDFYWFFNINSASEKKNIAGVVAADCTGHGVPGAFMSMLNSTLLNQTIYNPNIKTPSDALNFLNKELPKNLKSFDKNSTIQDGMDLAFCLIDFNTNVLQFAGANNPCLIIRDNQIIELSPLKQAITASEEFEKKQFTDETFTIQKGDTIYLYTDGFADQFGGPKGKKFKYKQLNELLLSIVNKSCIQQKQILETTFLEWKKELEQVDDVLIIGIKI